MHFEESSRKWRGCAGPTWRPRATRGRTSCLHGRRRPAVDPDNRSGHEVAQGTREIADVVGNIIHVSQPLHRLPHDVSQNVVFGFFQVFTPTVLFSGVAKLTVQLPRVGETRHDGIGGDAGESQLL